MKKLILRFGKWFNQEEFKNLKKNKREYSKFRRKLNKNMASKVDNNYLEKVSKSSGFSGKKHHFVGHRNKFKK